MSSSIEILYKHNYDYFKKKYPFFLKNLDSTNLSEFSIDISSSAPNIKFNNNFLYPNDPLQAIEDQISQFLTNYTAISHGICVHREIDCATIHNNILKKIENISPLLNMKNMTNYYNNSSLDTLPILQLFGIGNGLIIISLLKKIDIKHLIIIDQDYTFFKLSMHFIDWITIDNYFSKPGYKLEFIFSNDSDQIHDALVSNIKNNFPYKIYFIPTLIHYPTHFYNEVINALESSKMQILSSWGFIDDELLSLKRTLKNLEHNIPVYMGTNKKLPSNATLFIVASGPSIDKDIQYIKKNQDNAVIFSCGTALRVLEKNDIVPDFHFEIERGDGTHEILQQYTSQEFRDKVALIGLNVLNNKIFTEDFKEKYLYFRASDAGSSIVPDNIPKLFYTNPTVTNAAITFASEFVWDKVYLFGADMGFKDTQNHHSKDTFHYTQGEKKYNWDDHGAANITNEFPSNFGNDTVFSTRVFFTTKQAIENTLIQNNFVLYNCSDGAKIEYTLPYPSKDISIVSHNKQEVINTIKSNFKDLHTHEPQFKKNYKTQVQQYHETIDILKKKLTTRDIKSFGDIFDTLDDLFEIFNTIKNFKNNMGYIMLRGSFIAILSHIYSHSCAIHNKVEMIEFNKQSYQFLIQFLDNIKNSIK